MTTDPHADDGRSLVDLVAYRRAVRRRWPLVVVLAVLGATLGWYYGASSGESFQSTALIKVNEGLVSITTDGREAPNMATEVQVARSTVVTTQAALALDAGYTGTEFQRRATASSPPDASTIALTFQAPTADLAQRGATAWADAYLANRRADFEGALTRARDQVEARAVPLDAAYALALEAAVVAEPGTPADDRAEAQLDSIGNQLFAVRAELDSLSSIVVDPGTLISAPVRPEQSQGLPATIYLVAGGLVGLLLGAVLAIAVEQRFGRVRRSGDARQLLGVPAWELAEDRGSPDVFEPALEAVAARVSDAWRTLVVTDLGDETSSLVARQLADVLRANGDPVEMVAGRELAHHSSATLRLVAVPSVSGPEASAAMSRADAVVLVVRTGTRLADLRAARSAVEDCRTTVLAALVVRSSR